MYTYTLYLTYLSSNYIMIENNEIKIKDLPLLIFLSPIRVLNSLWRESITLGQKSFTLVCQRHQLLTGFLAKGYLPGVSCQSRLSANDKGDNGMIPGAVHRSPGTCLTAEENLEKPQLGNFRWRLCDQWSPQMGTLICKWDRLDRSRLYFIPIRGNSFIT